MFTRQPVTQDPIEQALDKLASFGVPVDEIAEKAGALVGRLGSLDLFEILDQVTSVDPSQIDVGEMFGELKARYDELDPALKLPVAIAAGFVAARVVRWIAQ